MKALRDYVPTIAKSLMAGAVAFAGSAAVAYADGSATPAEWWTATAATVTALAAVWGVPNREVA